MDSKWRGAEATHSKHYETLKRVCSEQYRIEENKQVILRDKEEIRSDSVQSPTIPIATTATRLTSPPGTGQT